MVKDLAGMTDSWHMLDNSILYLNVGVNVTRSLQCISCIEQNEQVVNILAMSFPSVTSELQLTCSHDSERPQTSVCHQQIPLHCWRNSGWTSTGTRSFSIHLTVLVPPMISWNFTFIDDHKSPHQIQHFNNFKAILLTKCYFAFTTTSWVSG